MSQLSSVWQLPPRVSPIGRSVNQTLMALHTECFTSEKSARLTWPVKYDNYIDDNDKDKDLVQNRKALQRQASNELLLLRIPLNVETHSCGDPRPDSDQLWPNRQ